MNLVRFVVFSNLWIGLGAASTSLLVYLITGIPVDLPVVLFNGAATSFSYGLQRYRRIKDESNGSDRHKWLFSNRKLNLAITISMLVLSGISLSFLELRSLAFLIPLGAMSLFYSGFGRFALREIPFIKIHLISLSWMLLCTGLPIVEFAGWEALISIESIALHVMVFAYILAITIPFDIRDLIYDPADQRTIPQIMGIERSRQISGACLALSAGVLIALSTSTYIPKSILVGVILSDVVAAILIFRSDVSKPELFYSGALDGTIVLRYVLPLIFVQLF